MKSNGHLLGVLVVIQLVRDVVQDSNNFLSSLSDPFEFLGILIGYTWMSAALLFIPAIIVGFVAKLLKKDYSNAFHATSIIMFVTLILLFGIAFVHTLYVKSRLGT